MTWTKTQTGIVSAIVAASVLVPLAIQQHAQAKLGEQDNVLRKQAQQLASVQDENRRLSNLAANSSLSQDQLNDLEKLQAEVSALRQQTHDVPKLQEENRRLRQAVLKPKTAIQLHKEAVAKATNGKNWAFAFWAFAEKNHDQFPTSFDQAAAFLPAQIRTEAEAATDQFEIVYQGSRSSPEHPQDVILLREREAWNAGDNSDPPGRWAKIYIFADGHAETHLEPNNNFDDYERAHIIPPVTSNR